MNYKPIATIALSSVFIFSSWCFSNEEAQMKHPPKPKPEPEELSLPAPFDKWDECVLLSKVYSAYNCDTGIIGKKDTDTQSEIGDEIAEVHKVSIWKAGGKKQLLILIETRFAQPFEAGSAGKGVDLALFDKVNGTLNLTAVASGVAGYREFGDSKLDLAPYKVNSKETAIGVRWSSGISGIGEEYLDLFRLERKTFRKIFSRRMWFTNDVNVSKSILQVIQKPSGMNDFLVITTVYPLNEAGEKEIAHSKKTAETWHWNHQTLTYERVE